MKFLGTLAEAIEKSKESTVKNYLSLSISKAVTGIVPVLPALKDELKQMEGGTIKDWVKLVETMNLKGINAQILAALGKYITGALVKIPLKVNDDLAKEIQSVFYLSIILVENYFKCKTFSDTPIKYSVTNPAEDFWFRRVDLAGDHQFNTAEGYYLINSIPPCDGKDYCNSEIYNSPYTQIEPVNSIANTVSLEVISDSIELYNFFYDLFINIPFSASHNIVFTARIKVENLKGGSRGWGFWNTNPIPVVGMKTVWFLQQEGDGEASNNGFFAQTFTGLKIDSFKLPDLDEGWHDYKIVLNSSTVAYYIDGVAVHVLNDPDFVPDGPMAYHNWVDNSVFDFAGGTGQKLLQKTDSDRKNFTESMTIETN
ncbi:MAG TPA: hypothetical protein DIW31_07500 [Bacteroidales bacterium]|nr:hypothetical protein [Bacteroidales bacterium]